MQQFQLSGHGTGHKRVLRQGSHGAASMRTSKPMAHPRADGDLDQDIDEDKFSRY